MRNKNLVQPAMASQLHQHHMERPGSIVRDRLLHGRSEVNPKSQLADLQTVQDIFV